MYNKCMGLEREICVDGERLEEVSEFKYLGCVVDDSGTDVAVCRRKLQALSGPWLMLGVCSSRV